MSDPSQFDSYLNNDGPAALVIREHLIPVEGPDGVLFPATFAENKSIGFPGGYNIDTDAQGRSVCLVDSVGAQANRIEPLFMREGYRHLVPQVVVKAGAKEISILEAAHRAGDAIIRCSTIQDEVEAAFSASIRGDAISLAKIAPTSLVFGVWNSRGQKGNQDRRPRLVASTIRAFNVRKLTRSAQFVPAVDYVGEGLVDEPAGKAEADAYAERGFIHVPASGSHGGVIADGGIRRDVTLGLATLRHLHAGRDADKTLVLRRYILGLSLVAFTAPTESYLRQGCTLVLDPDQPREFVEVYPDGRRLPCKVSHDDALKFATVAAEAFGVGESRTVPFEKERAKRDVKADEGGKARAKRGSKRAEAAESDAEGN